MPTITTPKGAGHHEFSDAAAGRDQAWKPDKIKAWVMSHIAIGERFKAPIDSYSSVLVFGYSDRMVVGFYPHYVLTVDDYDHTEDVPVFRHDGVVEEVMDHDNQRNHRRFAARGLPDIQTSAEGSDQDPRGD